MGLSLAITALLITQPRERSKMLTAKWTVWVGGGEVNSHYLEEHQAKDIAQAWIDKGYDDVVVEEVNK